MEITIQFYNCTAEPNYVYKYDKSKQSSDFLTFIKEVKGVLKEEQDITAPIFTIALPSDKAEEIFNSNYAYVDGIFKRWYFIVDRETGLNNTVTFYMTEDVLCSWQDEIGELVPLVTRQATDYDPYYIDGGIPIESKKSISESHYRIEHLQQSAAGDVYPFDGSGCYSISGFTNDSRAEGVSRNAISILNRVYVFESSYWTFWKKLANPTFWESLTSWFTDFASNIYFYKFIPFNVVASSTSDLLSADHQFQFVAGDLEFDDQDLNNAMIISDDTYCILKCEDIELETNHFNNFLDLYTVHSLFIPMLGRINLDTLLLKELNVKSVNVYYVINPNNWTCNVYVVVNEYSIDGISYSKYSVNFRNLQQINPYFTLFKSETFEIGIDIPFGSTNANQKNLAKLQYSVKAVASVALAPFTGGASLLGLADVSEMMSPTTAQLYKRTQDGRLKQGSKKYNERMSAYQTSMVKDIAATAIAKASNVISDIAPSLISQGHILNNSIGQYDFFGNFTYVTYVAEKVIPNIPSNYYELYGAPCNLTVALKTLKGKGFTICSNVHMSGFSKASISEINAIEQMLLSGVIF